METKVLMTYEMSLSADLILATKIIEETFTVAKVQYVRVDEKTGKTIRLNPSALKRVHITVDANIPTMRVWYKTDKSLSKDEEDVLLHSMKKRVTNYLSSLIHKLNIVNNTVPDVKLFNQQIKIKVS